MDEKMTKDCAVDEGKNSSETCPVCFNKYYKSIEKRFLPCFHSFCLNCLIEICVNDNIKCPLCRKVSSISCGVSSLPQNLFEVAVGLQKKISQMELREIEFERRLSEAGVRDRKSLVQSMKLTKSIEDSVFILSDCIKKLTTFLEHQFFNSKQLDELRQSFSSAESNIKNRLEKNEYFAAVNAFVNSKYVTAIFGMLAPVPQFHAYGQNFIDVEHDVVNYIGNVTTEVNKQDICHFIENLLVNAIPIRVIQESYLKNFSEHTVEISNDIVKKNVYNNPTQFSFIRALITSVVKCSLNLEERTLNKFVFRRWAKQILGHFVNNIDSHVLRRSNQLILLSEVNKLVTEEKYSKDVLQDILIILCDMGFASWATETYQSLHQSNNIAMPLQIQRENEFLPYLLMSCIKYFVRPIELIDISDENLN